MSFEQKYNKIKETIEAELIILEEGLKAPFHQDTPLNKQLLEFINAPSKRIRPTLGYLFIKAAAGEITAEQHKALLAVELIHNATLIHDDVIDKSERRRSQETLNSKFDDNLAVVAGDFLLSIAMEKIIETKSIEALSIFTSALKSTCIGEISQYFSRFKVSSIEQYIEKSKNKTALLFETGILAGIVLSKEKDNQSLKQTAEEFALNFGIAFQIRDDLINILKSDSLKPDMNDLNSGIYTAPVIFAYEKNTNLVNEISLEKIKTLGGIEKTQDLMDNYFDKAILALKDFEDNQYKQSIKDLADLLKVSV